MAQTQQHAYCIEHASGSHPLACSARLEHTEACSTRLEHTEACSTRLHAVTLLPACPSTWLDEFASTDIHHLRPVANQSKRSTSGLLSPNNARGTCVLLCNKARGVGWQLAWTLGAKACHVAATQFFAYVLLSALGTVLAETPRIPALGEHQEHEGVGAIRAIRALKGSPLKLEGSPLSPAQPQSPADEKMTEGGGARR